MTKRRICSLFFYDHHRHPIIARQIPALLSSGRFDVVILDSSKDATTIDGLRYTHVNVGTAELKLFSRWGWWVLRRLLSSRLANAYWAILSSLQTILTASRFVSYAWRTEADLYVAHDIETLVAAVVAGRVHHRPIVYDAHELASEQLDPSSARNRFIRRLEQRLIPLVDRIIVPNQSRAEYYQARHRLRADPLVVLNCPPAASWPKTDLLRKRLELPAGSRILVYHGGLLPGRALEELIQAASSFEQGTVLVMIGEPIAFVREVLEPLRYKEGVQNRVFFLPYMPYSEVMKYVASADLGVVIYKNINWNNYLCAPTKVYEYIMAELPFVGAKLPEIERLFMEYPVGLAFDPSEPRSIARAINGFFALTAAERNAMALHLQRARQRFTWEAESQKLITALAGLN
jgi:glycosyltransferase involved in cell wall biosynthesis